MTHSGRIQSQPGLQGRRGKIRTEANSMKDFSQKTQAEHNAKESNECKLQEPQNIHDNIGETSIINEGIDIHEESASQRDIHFWTSMAFY